MRQRAAGRLIAIPMDNTGGAFAFVSQDPRSRELLPSAQWARLMSALSGIRDRGGWVSAAIVYTLNETQHGDENRAAVTHKYECVRAHRRDRVGHSVPLSVILGSINKKNRC